MKVRRRPTDQCTVSLEIAAFIFFQRGMSSKLHRSIRTELTSGSENLLRAFRQRAERLILRLSAKLSVSSYFSHSLLISVSSSAPPRRTMLAFPSEAPQRNASEKAVG